MIPVPMITVPMVTGRRWRRTPPAATSRPAKRLHGRSFDGALAVVTGAGGGIGRATALEWSARGSRVVLIDVDPRAVADAAADINGAGGSARAYVGDVADDLAMDRLAAEIIEGFGPIDIVVNNAGVGMSSRFADMSVDDWHWIRSINLDGVLNGCRSFGRPMVAAGSGHVVNVSSGLAYTMRATEPAYVTTKAAVLAFSRCLRSDWDRQGVGVSVVCPGIVDTGIFAASRLRGDQAASRARDRGRRLFAAGHNPDKVARAICDAIEHDRGVVPVGWEARLGWWTMRLLPVGLERRVARLRVM